MNDKSVKLSPLSIFAGLGECERSTLSSLLVFFEDVTVLKVIQSYTKDLWKWIEKHSIDVFSSKDQEFRAKDNITKKALEDEIAKSTSRIANSNDSDGLLRFRLWCHIRHELGLQPALALSSGRATTLSAEIAQPYNRQVGELLWKEERKATSVLSSRYWNEYARYYLPMQGNPIKEIPFDIALTKMFELIIHKSVEGGEQDSESHDRLASMAWEYVEGLDEQKKRKLLKAAGVKELSRDTALTVLIGGGALAGTGVAVEIAGFAAYILAAKASAIIPFVGGKTLVSTLAVVADPLFIIAVVLGGGVFMGQTANRHIRAYMSLIVVTILTMYGIDLKTKGINRLCDDMRGAPNELPQEILWEYREFRNQREKEVPVIDRVTRTVSRSVTSVWKYIKYSAVAEEYPELFDYLHEWEIASGEML